MSARFSRHSNRLAQLLAQCEVDDCMFQSSRESINALIAIICKI